MSDTDLLKEIEADLQRQQLEAFWKKWGNAILTGVVLIVVGTACFEWWNTTRATTEQQATKTLLQLSQAAQLEPEKKIEELKSFSLETGEAGPAVLARLRGATAASSANKKEEAIKIYDALAQDQKVEIQFRQLGDIMAAQLLIDTLKTPQDATRLIARLQPLLADDCIWRYAAKEYTAHILLSQGKKEEALRLFQSLAQDPDVTETIGVRAHDIAFYLTSRLPSSESAPKADKKAEVKKEDKKS